MPSVRYGLLPPVSQSPGLEKMVEGVPGAGTAADLPQSAVSWLIPLWIGPAWPRYDVPPC